MDWRVGVPTVNRHFALRLDDLNNVNQDLLSVTKELIESAERASDEQTRETFAAEARKLADLSRRLSLATRSIAQVSVQFTDRP